MLIKAGPGAKPDQRKVTCLESLHRDQVTWASSPSRHTCRTQGFFPHPGARRLAGLLVTEGPRGRKGSQGEVGALGHQEEHQIAACKQPQKAFTSSHTTLRRGNTQVLLLGTKHCKTGAENTRGGEVKSKPSQNQLSELHHPPRPPTTTPVQPQRCRREGTSRCSSEHVSWEGTRERGRTSTTSPTEFPGAPEPLVPPCNTGDLGAACRAGKCPGRNNVPQKEKWFFFHPSSKVYMAHKGNTIEQTFLKLSMQLLRGFKCRWQGRGVSLSPPHSLRLGLGGPAPGARQGVEGIALDRDSCSGYRPWAQGAAPLSSTTAQHLENELEFWPDFTSKPVPSESCRPRLSFL